MSEYLVKLVRDQMGALLGDGQMTYRALTRREHVAWLRKKLVEEAIEYLADPSVGELGDVLEAVRSLAAVDLAADMATIEKAADKKRAERGGFDIGLGMFATNGESGLWAARDRLEAAGPYAGWWTHCRICGDGEQRVYLHGRRVDEGAAIYQSRCITCGDGFPMIVAAGERWRERVMLAGLCEGWDRIEVK